MPTPNRTGDAGRTRRISDDRVKTNLTLPKSARGCCIAPGDERSVAQPSIEFAVKKRRSGRVENDASRRAQYGVGGGGVPFHRRPESGIDITLAFGDDAKLQR